MHMLLPTHAYAPTHTHAIGNIILGQNSYLHTSLQPTYEARTRQKHHLQATYKGQTWPELSLTRYLQGANVAGKITYKVLTRGKRGRKNHLQGTYKEPYKKLTRGKQGRGQKLRGCKRVYVRRASTNYEPQPCPRYNLVGVVGS